MRSLYGCAAKCSFPLFFEQEVVGFIAVGEKRSGDPFFNQDIEFLATIGHQAGAALKRSQLHEEVNWMKEYNESILRHMESGLVVVSHDNLITVVNEAAARLLGIQATEIARSASRSAHGLWTGSAAPRYALGEGNLC